MSHNRQIEPQPATAHHATQDFPPAVIPASISVSGQPLSQQHQQSSASAARSSHTNSTLADSLRALRDHKSSSTSSSTRPSFFSSASYSSPSSTLPFPVSHPAESLASRRKGAKPSPLKEQDSPTNAGGKLYGRQGLNSPLSPTSLQAFALPPLSELPSSPKERIEALLAHSPATPSTEHNSLDPSPRKSSESTIYRQVRPNAQARKGSLPSTLAQMSLSPPISPTSTIVTASPKPSNVLAVMQRNSSVDSSASAVSSTTTNSQTTRQNSTGGKTVVEPEAEFDAAAFIAQAGSAEVAVQNLWKEKQNAANHNTQLWRLVEKQRAVLLGLQKDMDKAFKEREKYRKRLKDHMASCPSASSPTKFETQESLREPLLVASPSIPGGGAGDSSIIKPQAASIRDTTTTSATLVTDEVSSPKDVPVTPKMPMHNYKDSETLGSMANSFAVSSGEKRQTAINLADARVASPISPAGTASNNTSVDASPVTTNSAGGEHSVERIATPLTEPSLTAELSPADKETPKASLPMDQPTTPPVTTQPLVTMAPVIMPSNPPATMPPIPTITAPQDIPTRLPPNPPTTAPPPPPPAVAVASVAAAEPVAFPSPPRATITTRKPAPAPLNLVKSNITAVNDRLKAEAKAEAKVDALSPALSAASDTSFTPDSIERGRRRTRQDDDMMREAVAIQEEVARSASTQQPSKSSTPQPSAALPSAAIAFMKQASTHSPSVSAPSPKAPLVQTIPPSPRDMPNMPSLLSPAMSDSSTRAIRHSVMPPFASPGLPASPRPEHAPNNVAVQRELKPASESSIMTSTILESPQTDDAMSSPEPIVQRANVPPPGFTLPQINPVEVTQKRVSAVPAPLFAKKPVEAVDIFPAQQEVQETQEEPQRTAPVPPVPPAPPVTASHQVPPERPETKVDPNASLNVFRGFASKIYPGLLVAPGSLPLIEIRVVSSRMRPSRNSILLSVEEDPVFLLGIYTKGENKQLWRVEKNPQSLAALHYTMEAISGFDGKLPDTSLFQGHAPAKIDARREALNAYFAAMLALSLTEDAAVVICGFLSVDALEPEKESLITNVELVSEADGPLKNEGLPLREGYLTKRGKNFGGWKARYFTLSGPELKYYDSPGGPQIGAIKLFGAQIGKQATGKSSESPMGRGDEDNQYRHAFLVLEPKKRDTSSYMRHVLCAESDDERDAWVVACLAYIDVRAEEKPRAQSTSSRQTEQEPSASSLNASQSSTTLAESYRQNTSSPSSAANTRPDLAGRNISSSSNPYLTRGDERVVAEPNAPYVPNQVQTLGVSYESTVQAEAPRMGRSISSNNVTDSPSPSTTSFPRGTPTMGQKEFTISGPTNGAKISDMTSWGLRAPAANGTKTPAKEKKRSIFGFSSKPRLASDPSIERAAMAQRTVPTRSVFGMPLAEAVEMCPPYGVDILLPAVVYRCIDYLRAMDAADEEGIFRLSGSNVTIKSLRERFTREGDIDLLDGEYCDIHAVASLLKLYLRELPQSILTRDLHMQFLNVNGLDEHSKKIKAANVLVHKLPPANFHLLKALCGFLQDVVSRSDKNKMNVRNVGIVFAPTLNVAAWLISLLLTDYDGIFGDPYPEELSPIREVTIAAPEPSDPLRSPRQQVFTDLPTPTHNQTSFPSSVGGFQPLNSSPKAQNKIQSRTSYVPLGHQMHSQTGNRAQPAPIAPQHTQPHNEWAGPSSTVVQQNSQYMRRPQQHPSFPHPAALSVGPPSHQPSIQRTGSPQQGYPGTNTYSTTPSNNFVDPRRNRRESNMMGQDNGYMPKRPVQPQTLRDTNSSRLGPSSIY